MEKKFKVNYSYFDPTTGISVTRIETKIGTFVGTAFLQDEDKENTSKLAGCRLAELKAMRNYYIAFVKRLKLEARGMKQICDAIDTSIKATDKNDLRPAAKIAKRNYNKKLREIKIVEQKIIDVKNYIDYSIKVRDEYLKKQKDKIK